VCRVVPLAVIGLALCAAGCAIHPLPEDITGVPTYTIVRQIRCETRQAVADSAIGWLTHDDRVDPASRAIGIQFANGRPIEQLRPGLFKGEVASIVKLFFSTGVAYNFDLQMTEINNVDSQVDFLKPFLHQKHTLGIKAGLDRQRVNERTFTVTDTFGGLIRLPRDYCEGHLVLENYIYPITGKIGSKHLVEDFINLTLFGNLAGPQANTKGPPTLVDALSFQTLITGTVSPMVIFTPYTAGLGLMDASLTGVASRTDLHKITMGLAIAGPGVPLVAPVRTSLFTAPLVTIQPNVTSPEAAAAAAVSQYLTLKLFSPTISVTPDNRLFSPTVTVTP
jgi:hypothetical protein